MKASHLLCIVWIVWIYYIWRICFNLKLDFIDIYHNTHRHRHSHTKTHMFHYVTLAHSYIFSKKKYSSFWIQTPHIQTHTNIAAEYYPFVEPLAGLFYVQQFMQTMKSALYERYDQRGEKKSFNMLSRV